MTSLRGIGAIYLNHINRMSILFHDVLSLIAWAGLQAACVVAIITQASGDHDCDNKGKKMDLGLSGKVALITGASRGLGEAIAIELAREGVDVCLAARDEAKLNEVAGAIAAQSQVGTLVYAGDFRDPEVPKDAVARCVARFGRLDILVNNAGATKRGDFLKLTEEDWQDGYALKFHGYVRMTRAAWPHLRDSRGSIVNIAGIGALAGAAEFTIGGSVNAAILYFTKAMADQGVTDGVRVNAINPGHIATDRLLRNFDRMAADQGVTRDQAADQLLAGCRTERFGRPQEIGAVTAFLASAQASFVQGALIDVDGGETRSL